MAEKKIAPRICANCKWSKEADYFDGDFMACECHRYPPTVLSTSNLSAWPRTRPESTCGEFAIMRHPRAFEFADKDGLANAAAPAA